jgi:hypothetical protein
MPDLLNGHQLADHVKLNAIIARAKPEVACQLAA